MVFFGISYLHNYSDRTMAPECVGLTTIVPIRTDCLESWDPQIPGTPRPLQACIRIALPLPFSLIP